MDCPLCIADTRLCDCDREIEHDSSNSDCECHLCLCEQADHLKDDDYLTTLTSKGL